MKRIIIPILTALLLPALLLTGCGQREDPFQVVFAAPFVNEDIVDAYSAGLAPATQTPVNYTAFSFGSETVDASAYAAGAMMMTAMMAAGEVDVLVCDLGEAARYARSGSFLDPTTLFTEDELAGLSDRLVTFDLVDMNAKPTGETTAPCGLDLSGRKELDFVLASPGYGIFIVANTADPEAAKAVFREIAQF